MVVDVVVPRGMTAEQREHLRRFHDSLTEANLDGAAQDGGGEGVGAKLRRLLRLS